MDNSQFEMNKGDEEDDCEIEQADKEELSKKSNYNRYPILSINTQSE